jgi:hypothetical protein
MPRVRLAEGRVVRCGRKAVPSSPAPRRKILVWGVGDIVKVLVVYSCCG